MKNTILEEYFSSLRKSGYKEREVRKFPIDGITGYTRREKREDKGGEPIHRSKANIQKGTYKKKLTIRQDWYKKGGNGDVTNCSNKTYKPKTWGNNAESVKGLGFTKDKVVEEGGRKLLDILVRKNLLGDSEKQQSSYPKPEG